MQQPRCGVSTLAILFAVFFSLGGTKEAAGQVQVNVNIGPPPKYVVAAPPPVVVIPGTYVYAIPDLAVDILFYGGSWYRRHEGHWFSARSYNGPWVYITPPRVPRALIDLPPDYRRVPPGYRRIPYGQFKKNYGRWERERYWEKDRGWREGWHGKPEGRGGEFREEGHGKPEGRGREFREEGHGKPEGRGREFREEGHGKPEGRGGEERGRGHEGR